MSASKLLRRMSYPPPPVTKERQQGRMLVKRRCLCVGGAAQIPGAASLLLCLFIGLEIFAHKDLVNYLDMTRGAGGPMCRAPSRWCARWRPPDLSWVITHLRLTCRLPREGKIKYSGGSQAGTCTCSALRGQRGGSSCQMYPIISKQI